MSDLVEGCIHFLVFVFDGRLMNEFLKMCVATEGEEGGDGFGMRRSEAHGAKMLLLLLLHHENR